MSDQLEDFSWFTLKSSSVCGVSRQAEVFTRTRHVGPKSENKTENDTESVELLYWPDGV